MSELLINQYQAEIAKYIQYGGDKKETSIRRAIVEADAGEFATKEEVKSMLKKWKSRAII